TAAYGSPLAEEVQILRQFRDRFLVTHAPGRLLVVGYYRLSPPLARMISTDEILQAAVRRLLGPVVWWANQFLVAPAFALALSASALLTGMSLLVMMPTLWGRWADRAARRRSRTT
ncbi:MAG: CFI-box-CTERM domain-containing protein, partial [Nitrospirota bacterium]